MDGADGGEDAGLAARVALDPTREAPLWATWLAGSLPFLYYVATASSSGYWFDAGEFVAAARSLGVTHPPGQPLSSLFQAVFALLPVGPLAFRIALCSAVAMGLALGFAFRALYHGLTTVDLLAPRTRALVCLAASYGLAGGVGVWMQAVRPEVYALQAALSFVALDGLIRHERDAPEGNLPALYVAALAGGLALANHHFLALLLFPAAAPSLGRVVVAHGGRPLWIAVGFGLLGLSTYLYLPLRAWADPVPNFGAPTDFSRFYWVLSAQAFQNTHALPTESAQERLLDVLVLLVRTVGVPLVVASVAGLYLCLRSPRLRRLGVLWFLVALVGALARAWLGFVRSNPDAMGYLMPVYLAVIALGTTFAAALMDKGLGRGRQAFRVAVVLVGVGLWNVDAGARTSDLSRFAATYHFERLALRALPEGAIVLLHEPQSIFRSLGARVERAERTDVTLVPLPLVFYPGMLEQLVNEAPALRGFLRGYLLSGQLRQPDLQSLAAERPLFLELDPRVSPELYPTLTPEGLLYRVMADGATERDERDGARTQVDALRKLYAALGPGPPEAATKERLVWLHYLNAMYYAAVADRASAELALSLGLHLAPASRELLALRDALRATEEGPLDVRPFMPVSDP